MFVQWGLVGMKDLNTDVFDPTAGMDSDYSRASCASSSDADFGFAFNDSNFSDRLLRIEIMGEPAESRPDSVGCTSILDWARRKRRREDCKKESGNFSFYLEFFDFLFCLFAEKLRLFG